MNKLSTQTYPLHVAVAMEDKVALEKLLNLKKYDINERDDLNITPLEIAAFLGYPDIVRLLIQKGADVSITKGYDQGFCALTLAVLNNHSDTVNILIEEGNSIERISSEDITYAFFYALDNLFLYIQEVKDNPQPFDDALNIFLSLIDHQDLPLIHFEEYGEIFSEPAVIWLEALTLYAPTQAVYDKLMLEVERINAVDSAYQTYLEAKLLLHVLPIDSSDYTITYQTPMGGEFEAHIDPGGFMRCFTTPFVSQEIDSYLNALNIKNNIKLNSINNTLTAFKEISDIYHEAILFSCAPAIIENSLLAYNLYQNGHTVLLATGWDGHAVNIILDPHHDYFIVANAGDRYDEFVGGSHIYQINNISNLGPDIIFDIMNNTERADLEFTYKYELALDKVEILEYPDQQYGNCAWYSHKPTIEALLYLHFLNEGADTNQAHYLANAYRLEWETYEYRHCLENYFDNDPRVNIDVILDILVDYHPSLFKDSKSPINLAEYAQAEYLVKILATDQYKNDFYDHFYWKLPEAKPELMQLFKSSELLMPIKQPFDSRKIVRLEDVFENSNTQSHSDLNNLENNPENNSASYLGSHLEIKQEGDFYTHYFEPLGPIDYSEYFNHSDVSLLDNFLLQNAQAI